MVDRGYELAIDPYPRRVRVMVDGLALADSEQAVLLRETRHAPVLYFPRADVRTDLLEPSGHRTHCPFKGDATYWTVKTGARVLENAVWAYEEPLRDVASLAGHVAFYRERMDEWLEEGEPIALSSDADAHPDPNPLVDWVLRDAPKSASIEEIVLGLSSRLCAIGMSLTRVNLIVRTLHPQVMGTLHVWEPEGNAVERVELTHASSKEERFLSSPFVHIFEGRGGVRRRLIGPDARIDYPILQQLGAGGATDYAAMPLHFSDGQIHALTLVTNAPSGFATGDLGHLHEILPILSRLVEAHAMRGTARTLLDTYLGSGTGGRVLDGLVRRGDGEVIPAVIWWADLRGSTEMAERVPRDRYLDLLNQFFDCTAGAAMAHGGEVLKFIGDAVLAIFPLREDPRAAEHALEAAREALERIARNNRTPGNESDPLAVALALHRGEVNYGNVGVEGRLDFTVTGPAVNQVARLERISKTLNEEIVASRPFADLVEGRMRSLGHQELRGFQEPVEVFTLKEGA